MDKLPTLLEELERKTVDLLEAKLTDYERGTLSGADLSIIGKTAWNIVSGLVSNDISEMCVQAADEGNRKPLSRYFVGHGKAMRINWITGADSFTVQSISTESLVVNERVQTTATGEADSQVEKFAKKLLAMDYIEI